MPISDFDRYFSDAAIESDQVGPADSGTVAVSTAGSPTSVAATFPLDAQGNQTSLNRIKWILTIFGLAGGGTIGTINLTANDGLGHNQTIASYAAPVAPAVELELEGAATITGLTQLKNFVTLTASIVMAGGGGTGSARLRMLGNQ